VLVRTLLERVRRELEPPVLGRLPLALLGPLGS
jgi:hypothetical protein